MTPTPKDIQDRVEAEIVRLVYELATAKAVIAVLERRIAEKADDHPRGV